ncbi:MAG TPA: hypothetical protein VM935_12940 [Chitinophagaceae bacterium]|nr:hypothetical protein [Chitinophagaceae bacterium]
MIDYNNRRFVVRSNSGNGALDGDTKFSYQQEGSIVTCTYFGNNIIKGHLLAVVGALGELDMRYHQVSRSGELMTGTCSSTPEILPNGKIRLHEKWKWTSGDYSEGSSVLEEE